MQSIRKIWSETFCVRSYEMNLHGWATVPTLTRYLQEVASNHANHLGFSVDALFERNLTWVLSRLHLQIKRYPRWGETMVLETWPSGVSGRFALRDYRMLDEHRHEIGCGTSSWMVMDLLSRRPVRIPEFISSVNLPDRERALEDSFERLTKPEHFDVEKTFEVRFADLDINQHVNNISYIEWVIETISTELWKKYKLVELEIGYRAESMLGDLILSRAQQFKENEQVSLVHQLVQSAEQKELARAKTVWEPL